MGGINLVWNSFLKAGTNQNRETNVGELSKSNPDHDEGCLLKSKKENNKRQEN
jgi:hypothetical protein